MADQNQHSDILWRIVEYGGWLVGAALSAMGGWLWRTYRKDRILLHRLRRDMDEINEIRDAMEDGDVPLGQIADLESQMQILTDTVRGIDSKVEKMETNYHSVAMSQARMETKVDWLCDIWKNDRPYK